MTTWEDCPSAVYQWPLLSVATSLELAEELSNLLVIVNAI